MYTIKHLKLKVLAAHIAAAVLMTACGGGSSGGGNTTPSVATVSARLASPAIEGLAYVGSQSSSGKTGATGEYSCKSGETVSFKLGSVVLGSVTCPQASGQATSLFTLAGGGVTPDTLLADMRKASGTLEVLAFDLWMNRLNLLASLDTNEELTDGVQLPVGLDALPSLQSGRVKFDQDASLFDPQVEQVLLQAAKAGLYQRELYANNQYTAGLFKRLEKESGGALSFPDYAITRVDSDPGAVAEVYTHDSFGQVIKMDSSDVNRTWGYNTNGLVTSFVKKSGDSRFEVSQEYGSCGCVVKAVETTYATDGSKTLEQTTTYIRDAHDYVTQEDIVVDDFLGKTRTITTHKYTLNSEFNRTGDESTVTTVMVNGVVDASQGSRTAIHRVFDTAGNMTSSALEVSNSSGGFMSKQVENYAYNDDGRVTQRSYRRLDASGNTLSGNETAFTYTAEGYARTAERVYKENGQETGRYKDIYQYDNNGAALKGKLTQRVRAYYHPDYAGGKNPTRVWLLTYAYNEQGLRTTVKEKITEYQDGNGVALTTPTSTSSVEQWEYDANNNPVSVKHDENGDGVFENAKAYKWQRFATLGVFEIHANADLFPSHDGEWRVNNTSEEGWEAALLATGTAVGSGSYGLSLPPSSLALPVIPLTPLDMRVIPVIGDLNTSFGSD